MEFRYVEETDPTRQALLEIYCAFALGTRYNDFENRWFRTADGQLHRLLAAARSISTPMMKHHSAKQASNS